MRNIHHGRQILISAYRSIQLIDGCPEKKLQGGGASKTKFLNYVLFLGNRRIPGKDLLAPYK